MINATHYTGDQRMRVMTKSVPIKPGVFRSIGRVHLNKQFAFEIQSRYIISGIFVKQGPFKDSTLAVCVGKMKSYRLPVQTT